MKSRMDMGEALRNTTLVSRPSDMFFLPSTTGAASDTASEPADSAHAVPATDGTDAASPSDDETRTTAAADTEEPAVTGTSTDPATDVSRETTKNDDARSEPTTKGTTSRAPRRSSASPSAPPADANGDMDGDIDGDVLDFTVSRETATPRKSADTVDVAATMTGFQQAAVPDDDVSRETANAGQQLAAVPGATFAEIPVSSIHPNRKQPRQVFDEEELAELAYSIGELGVLQPIVVRPTREDGEESYELVMGERRWRATQRAGLPTIPAIVRETPDDDLLRDALLENLHRSQLNPLEEAAAYQQLLEEFGTTQEELSRRIGRSRPQISNTIRLLRLPPLVQRRVAAGVLSSGHARALLGLADPAAMERLAQRIVAEGLSVRATEEAVQLSESGERPPQRKAAPAGQHKERLDYLAEAFSDRLDTSVRIALGARKGRMTIEFATVEDLNRIIEVLDPGVDRT